MSKATETKKDHNQEENNIFPPPSLVVLCYYTINSIAPEMFPKISETLSFTNLKKLTI